MEKYGKLVEGLVFASASSSSHDAMFFGILLVMVIAQRARLEASSYSISRTILYDQLVRSITLKRRNKDKDLVVS